MPSTRASKLTGFTTLIKQVYSLVRPYGLRKLFKVTVVSLLQALSQVVSVAAIFPFLAIAADPAQFKESKPGQWLVLLFPGMDNQQLLMITGAGLIVALFIANGFNLYGEVYRARFTWGFAHWLRMRMLHRINDRPYSWFLQQNTSILIKKATQDIVQFVNGILSPIIDGTSRLMITVLLLITIIIAEPEIALSVALALGLTYLVIFIFLANFRRYLSDSLKIHWRGVFQQVGQFLSGIKTVKVYGVDTAFLERINEHSRNQSELQAWMPIVGNGPRYLIEPVIAGVFIFLVLKAIGSGESAAALVPGLGLIAMAGYKLLPAVQMLYSQLSTLQTSRYVLDEIYDEFREAEEEKAEPSVGRQTEMGVNTLPFEKSIKLQDISFKYQSGQKEVLKNVNLAIQKNTSIAFIGETGSGKSTLVDLILGLHQPTKGEILVDNTAIDTKEKIRFWQDKIGYVPQDIFLADDTIAHNIAFGIPDEDINHGRICEVATMAQIADFIEKELPKKYQTEVGERGVRLSGGQRQRIVLARALYHKPEVLLLDEATSALDNETEERFMDIIYGLVGKFTVIMVAHRLSTIQRASEHYIAEGGQIKLKES